MSEQRAGEPKASLLKALGAERGTFHHPTGERLPYAEVHSQAKILIDLAKSVIGDLPKFQRAAARAFWDRENRISFQAEDFRGVTLTYYGPRMGRERFDESESIHISKDSIEGETRVSISFGHDEETNKRIAGKIRPGGYRQGNEAPSTSDVSYEGPWIRDENGFIRKIQDTQQTIDVIKEFIESLK